MNPAQKRDAEDRDQAFDHHHWNVGADDQQGDFQKVFLRERQGGTGDNGPQENADESAGKGMFFVRSANVRNLVTDPALEQQIKLAANRNFEIAAKQKEVELAKAEAERKRVEAQGEADAIRLRASAIQAQGGKEYVELEAIKKWDGKLPTTMPGVATPFIHVK